MAITDPFDAPRLPGVPAVSTSWSTAATSKSSHQAPDHPMQMMIAVFDFPARGPSDHVPMLAVDHLRGA